MVLKYKSCYKIKYSFTKTVGLIIFPSSFPCNISVSCLIPGDRAKMLVLLSYLGVAILNKYLSYPTTSHLSGVLRMEVTQSGLLEPPRVTSLAYDTGGTMVGNYSDGTRRLCEEM